VHIGHYISGTGHAALIGWLVFGDVFAAEPLPMQVTSVSVVTGADYAAAVAAWQSPQSATEVAQPASPDAQEAPEVSAVEDSQTKLTQPEASQTPSAEDPPDVTQLAPPPQADVSDAAPELPQPPADLAVDTPNVADESVPQAAERIAPEAVAQPAPEALPDPVEQEAVQEDETGDIERETADATAPEEAATEIVTEAEEPATTMTASARPPARRPAPTQPVAQPDPEPEDNVADAVAGAVTEAMETAATPAAPSGPPLSAGEKEALRVAVSSCWNVGSLSSDALRTTVVVSVAMAQDGKPVTSSIRMASFSGGSDAAARQAFEAARRAIIRCGARGYDLPADKYGQWQNIEMTFNPERMRIK
jgi:hypothetical protein